MKRGFLILAVILPGALWAQEAPGAKRAPKPTTQQAAEAFAVSAPDEGSPFFSEREEANTLVADETHQQSNPDTLAIYPRTKGDAKSAMGTFTHFFTDMFSSVHVASLHEDKTTQGLIIDPSAFSLANKHEVDTTYTVRNNTSKIMRLNYTTTQRVEVVARDASGKQLFSSADEHMIDPEDGIVIINPKERIQYEQPIPTRVMKPNQPTVIQADAVGYPDYAVSGTVKPTP